jgi:hypothetical protein
MMPNNRRVLLYSILLSLLLTGSVMAVAEGTGGQAGFCEKIKPCQILTQADAERMLGQPVRLIQNSSELRGDVRQCMCGYMGLSKDKASGQDCALYFSLEQKEATPSAEQAHQVLVSTKEANAHDHVIGDLSGIGDEAFSLSNDSDSHLIMARKGAVIMRLQVKRAAGTRSLEELKAFAERVFKTL